MVVVLLVLQTPVSYALYLVAVDAADPIVVRLQQLGFGLAALLPPCVVQVIGVHDAHLAAEQQR